MPRTLEIALFSEALATEMGECASTQPKMGHGGGGGRDRGQYPNVYGCGVCLCGFVYDKWFYNDAFWQFMLFIDAIELKEYNKLCK